MVHLTILGVPGEGSIYLYFWRVCSVQFYMNQLEKLEAAKAA